MKMSPATLTAVLDLDDGTEAAVESGIIAAPASGGRSMVTFPVEGVSPQARIAGVLIHCGNGVMFRRWFKPCLTVPPGGALTVSFGVADMRRPEVT